MTQTGEVWYALALTRSIKWCKPCRGSTRIIGPMKKSLDIRTFDEGFSSADEAILHARAFVTPNAHTCIMATRDLKSTVAKIKKKAKSCCLMRTSLRNRFGTAVTVRN